MEVFKDTFGADFDKIEWVEADLTNAEQLEEAVKGCQYVLHVASPIPGVNTGSNNDYMIKVAQDGMVTMLNACQAQKVTKLVVTASVATMLGSVWKGKENPHYDENDYAFDHPQKVVDGYVMSKIMQEQEILKFRKAQRENPDEHQLEIVTLHPSFIVGPPLNHLASSSIEGFRKLCTGKVPIIPWLHAGNIDVRDCAQAHINALKMEDGKLVDERIIISNRSLWMHEQMQIIREHFHDKGLRKIPTRVAGKKTMQAVSVFEPTVKVFIPRLGLEVQVNNQKSKDILDMKYEIPVEQTLIEMVEAMLKHKIIEVDPPAPGGCGCSIM